MRAKTTLTWLTAALLAVPALALAAPLTAAARQQTQMAVAHAGMALGAGTLKLAHEHLHHVLNCLEGPKGKGFDAAFFDPCQGMGQGAIPDAAGDPAAQAGLQAAARLAERGLSTHTLAAAHADAKTLMDDLQRIANPPMPSPPAAAH